MLKRIAASRYRLSMSIVLLALALIATGCSTEVQPVDMVLIIDTSGSMRGAEGAENIFSRVQETAQEIVGETVPGSSVTLISYDSDTHVFPKVRIDGERDRARVEQQIADLLANGKHTYTAKAIQDGFAAAEKNESEHPTNPQVVILLTDGLNDPPPSAGPNPLDLGEVIQPYAGKPWYVHYVQLGKDFDKDLEKKISQNFPNATTTKDTGGKHLSSLPKKTSDKWKRSAIKAGKWTLKIGLWTIIGAVGVLILIVLVILAARAKAYAKGKQLYGTLEYWQTDNSNAKCIKDLAECGMSESVGATGIVLTGCSVELMRLSTTKEGGQWVVIAHTKGDDTSVSGTIRFKGKAYPHMTLYNGDIFEVGQWSFRYRGDTGPRPR